MTFLYSCDVDPYKGKRPIDYPNTTWVCDEYGISFHVNSNGGLENSIIKTEEKVIYFELLWLSFDSTVCFYKSNDETKEDIFDGKCKFGEEAFSIKVDDTNGYFKEKSVVLKFVRMT